MALAALQHCQQSVLPSLLDLAVLLHDNALLSLGERSDVQVGGAGCLASHSLSLMLL